MIIAVIIGVVIVVACICECIADCYNMKCQKELKMNKCNCECKKD